MELKIKNICAAVMCASFLIVDPAWCSGADTDDTTTAALLDCKLEGKSKEELDAHKVKVVAALIAQNKQDGRVVFSKILEKLLLKANGVEDPVSKKALIEIAVDIAEHTKYQEAFINSVCKAKAEMENAVNAFEASIQGKYDLKN